VNYQEFLLFASRRLKLKFTVIEFWVRGFLRKYNLRPQTLECYLLWGQKKTFREIGKILNIDFTTVCRELKQLRSICPELFIRNPYIPQIPWMFHPTTEQWEVLDGSSKIKKKF